MSQAPAPTPVAVSTADRLAAVVAWAMWAGAIAIGLVGFAYGVASLSGPFPTTPQTVVSFLAAIAVGATYASVGLLLRLRRPGIVIGWLFLGIGLVSGLANVLWNYVWYSVSVGAAIGPISTIDAALLNTLIVVPGWAMLLFALILVFPNGHLVDRSWRPVLVLSFAIYAVFALSLALAPGPLLFFPVLSNPYGLEGTAGRAVALVADGAMVAIVVLGCAAVWSMVVRYRRSDDSGRRQLKWLAWGSSLAVVGGIILLLVASQTLDPSTNVADISWLIFAAGSVTLPMSALIAILREGLYDIDTLIGRTFVYGVLTAILAGVYAASVRLFNALFVGLTGESSEVALVLTTLILATTFTPIKQALERVATRRFGSSGAGSGGAAGTAGSVSVSATVSPGDVELDRRMEAIARRVAQEVLEGSRTES